MSFNHPLPRFTPRNLNRLADPNFGYETKGPSNERTMTDYIWGSFFPCPQTGIGQSITVYIKQYESCTPKIKCAIYEKLEVGPTGPLIGYTEEWQLTSGWDDWKAFNIVYGGELEADTVYFLVFWSDDSFTFYYITVGYQGGVDFKTYNSFPDPWSGDVPVGVMISIYCSYTVPPPTGGILAQIM